VVCESAECAKQLTNSTVELRSAPPLVVIVTLVECEAVGLRSLADRADRNQVRIAFLFGIRFGHVEAPCLAHKRTRLAKRVEALRFVTPRLTLE
jgi:hypothetical protein